MEASVRRLASEDISQVIEIEREAFSPLWVTTPFKRELNNRYACYLVACCDGGSLEEPGGRSGPRRLWPASLARPEEQGPQIGRGRSPG